MSSTQTRISDIDAVDILRSKRRGHAAHIDSVLSENFDRRSRALIIPPDCRILKRIPWAQVRSFSAQEGFGCRTTGLFLNFSYIILSCAACWSIMSRSSPWIAYYICKVQLEKCPCVFICHWILGIHLKFDHLVIGNCSWMLIISGFHSLSPKY